MALSGTLSTLRERLIALLAILAYFELSFVSTTSLIQAQTQASTRSSLPSFISIPISIPPNPRFEWSALLRVGHQC